jgi:sulfur carrier protein ThiS
MPLAGLQISQAREIAGRVLNLDPGAVALVNGQPVRANYRLQRGDTLEFVHHAGEKG